MAAKKEQRILIILESPNKIKTFKQFLPNNYIIMASVGHITKIADTGLYNMGIDVKNNFKADYKIADGKQEVVKKLKEQVKASDKVVLFADGDREGEAIAWHLKEQLKIPESKYIRCTVHEITKKAVLSALENSRKLDLDLVAAATSRQKADKIIGYRLSGIARKNVGAKSVGRCQSAGLKLIVLREEEIQNFKPEKYIDLYLNFKKNKTEFKAKYIGTDKKEVKSFANLEECKKVVDQCKKNNKYIISNIEHKDSLENPKLPFTTSTFQQEVTRRLGINVKGAMECAQKLFEGIDVGGKHIALITYIRTDSSDMAPEFKPVLEAFVKDKYGKEYFAPVKAAKKSVNEQDGHECIRCIDLELTPDKLAKYIDNERLIKVYRIIWQRTVAASMKPAIIANTIYTINNGDHKFTMVSKELKFDGYRAVYNYDAEEDNDDQLIKESFEKGEQLKNTTLEALEKETRPPARYDEASFVRTLEKSGIGRPSTFATILQVLLDDKRGYCKLEDKKIVPTELGIKLSHFLDKSFSSVISLTYTAELENQLDLIAKGDKDSIEFLEDFYKNLENDINKIEPSIPEGSQQEKCPECGSALVYRQGKFGPFLGCSNYPKCRFIKSLKKKD